MSRWRIFVVVLTVLIFTGCAGQMQWHSQPASAQLATSTFEATLEPVQPTGGAFFEGFQFTLVNRSDASLWIDWSQSRYMHNDRPRGTFAFAGLTAETIKQPPAEEVAPGRRLAKTIWPLQLLGWVPIKDRSLSPDESGFSPGVLPEGENGVLLFIGQPGEWEQKKLSVNLSSHAQ